MRFTLLLQIHEVNKSKLVTNVDSSGVKDAKTELLQQSQIISFLYDEAFHTDKDYRGNAKMIIITMLVWT